MIGLQTVLEKAKEKVGEYVKAAGQVFEEDGAIGKQFTPEGKAGASLLTNAQPCADCTSMCMYVYGNLSHTCASSLTHSPAVEGPECGYSMDVVKTSSYKMIKRMSAPHSYVVRVHVLRSCALVRLLCLVYIVMLSTHSLSCALFRLYVVVPLPFARAVSLFTQPSHLVIVVYSCNFSLSPNVVISN